MDAEYREIQAILITEKGRISDIFKNVNISNGKPQKLVYTQTPNEDILVFASYTHKPLNTVLLPITNVVAELTKKQVTPKVFSVLEYQNSINKWIKPTDENYAFPYFTNQTENETYTVLEFYFPTKKWQSHIQATLKHLETRIPEIIHTRFCWENYLVYFTLKLQGTTFDEVRPQIEHIADQIFTALKELINEHDSLQDGLTSLDPGIDEYPYMKNGKGNTLWDKNLEHVIIEAFTDPKSKGIIYLKEGACPIRIELFGDSTTIYPESPNHPVIPYSTYRSSLDSLQKYTVY